MNETPKYVVSETLQKADWNNSTIIDGYSAETIGALKDQVDGGIYISGSGTLVRALLADGLVDELNLFVYPVVLGTGARLFGDEPVKFTLAQTHSYENGVLHLAYQRA
jgi:dihydrofolate reductase